MNRNELSKFHSLLVLLGAVLLSLVLVAGCEDDEGDGPTGSGVASSWEVQSPVVEGNHFFGAHFVSADEGWLVGREGAILHTADGGETWTEQSSGTNSDLYAVRFRGPDTGWVVGASGKLLHTFNGGATWSDRLIPVTDRSVYDVEFPSERKGFAVGAEGTLLYSVDVGRRWTSRSIDTRIGFRSLDIWGTEAVMVGDSGFVGLFTRYDEVVERLATDTVDIDTGIVIDTTWDFDTVLVIDSSGTPWDTTAIPDSTLISEDTTFSFTFFTDTLYLTIDTIWSGFDGILTPTTERLNSVAYADADNVWAVGAAGTVLHSADGGQSWAAVTSGVAVDLYAVCFPDANNGCIVGGDGTVLTTSDGGGTWIEIESGVPFELRAVSMAGSAHWIAGRLAIMQSTDGGASWTMFETGTPPLPSLTDITFADASTGFISGYGGLILRTVDNGSDWVMLRRDRRYAPTEYFRTVISASGSYVWAGGLSGVPPYKGMLMRSGNLGDTWEQYVYDTVAPPPVNQIADLQFIDSLNGYMAAGSDVYRTADGGIIWEPTFSSANDEVREIQFLGSDTGFVVGRENTILKTIDGGTTWAVPTEDSVVGEFNAVFFVDEDWGWIAGNNGVIWSTADGGVNWIEQDAGTDAHLIDLFFLDNLVGYAIGSGGTILYTSDGGSTWTRQGSPVSGTLTGIYMQDADHGWIVGENGIILRTEVGGR